MYKTGVGDAVKGCNFKCLFCRPDAKNNIVVLAETEMRDKTQFNPL